MAENLNFKCLMEITSRIYQDILMSNIVLFNTRRAWCFLRHSTLYRYKHRTLWALSCMLLSTYKVFHVSGVHEVLSYFSVRICGWAVISNYWVASSGCFSNISVVLCLVTPRICREMISCEVTKSSCCNLPDAFQLNTGSCWAEPLNMP